MSCIDKGRSLITNVLQLTRAARSWSELRAVRVLAVFCYLFGIGALLEREHTHRARVQPRSGMQIHIFCTLRRTPRVRSLALTPSPLEPLEQMHTTEKRRAGLQFSGQLRADKTTQTNSTDTTAAGGAPEQTYHRHLRPLMRRDAFAIEGQSKSEGSNAKVRRGPCKPRRLVSFLHFFQKVSQESSPKT
jgi:hypothetical protein